MQIRSNKKTKFLYDIFYAKIFDFAKSHVLKLYKISFYIHKIYFEKIFYHKIRNENFHQVSNDFVYHFNFKFRGS